MTNIIYKVRVVPNITDEEFDTILQSFGASVLLPRDDYHNIQRVSIPENKEQACFEFLEGHEYVIWSYKEVPAKPCYVPNNNLYPITNQSFFQIWGIEKAWDITRGGASIALIDDSVDGTHPDMILKGSNLIAGTGGALSNSGGHGTYTGGAAAAPNDTGVGIPGIAGASPLVVYALGGSGNPETLNSAPETVMSTVISNAKLTGNIAAKIVSLSVAGAFTAPAPITILPYNQIKIIGNTSTTLAGSSVRVATSSDGSVRAQRIILGGTTISGSDTIATIANYLDGPITGCNTIYIPEKSFDTYAQQAALYNIIIIVAAGNNNGSSTYNPYCISSNCIAVGAVDGGNGLCEFPLESVPSFISLATLSGVAGYSNTGSNIDVFAPANGVAVQQSKSDTETSEYYFAMSYPVTLTAGSTSAVLTNSVSYPSQGIFRPFDASGYISANTFLTYSSNIAPGVSSVPAGTALTLSKPALTTVSTTLTMTYYQNGGSCGFYAGVSGTSLSCPRVAGIVALMRTVQPNLSIEAIRHILLSTSAPTSTTNFIAGTAMPYPSLLLAQKGGQTVFNSTGNLVEEYRYDASPLKSYDRNGNQI